MHEVYVRYFRVTEGPVAQRCVDIEAQRKEVADQWQVLADDIGADGCAFYNSIGSFGGFSFSTNPDLNVFRKSKDGYWHPRKNTKAGKALAQRVAAMPHLPVLKDALQVLDPRPAEMIDGRRGTISFPTVFGNSKCGVWYVGVPWRSSAEEPHDDEKLAWSPPDGWVELSRHDLDQEIASLNSRLKDGNA